MPKISATAEWWPSEPILPRAVNENSRLAPPRIAAAMFCAAHLASRVACWAVGGQGSPVLVSMTHAQSPMAQTPGWSGSSRCRPTMIRPFSFFTGSAATSGFGAEGTVLGEPGLTREARDVAERDHEVVVLERALARAEARRRRHTLPVEIDLVHGTRVEVRARAEAPDRRDRVEDSDTAGDHLGEHRLEDDVVVAADEPELDAAVPDLALQELLEGQRRVDAAEATAEDEDADGSISHSCPL